MRTSPALGEPWGTLGNLVISGEYNVVTFTVFSHCLAWNPSAFLKAKRPCGLCPPESFCPIGPEIFKSYSYGAPVAKRGGGAKMGGLGILHGLCFHVGVFKIGVYPVPQGTI